MSGIQDGIRPPPETVGPEAIRLREVQVSDLAKFFDHQLDPEANRMAAFTSKDPSDRSAFMEEWTKILRDPRVIARTVLVTDRVRGHILLFPRLGKPSLAYWYARDAWGQGIATNALREFLRIVPARPVFARVAKDHRASLRVLEKCGFQVCGEEKGFANARAAEIPELILRRDAP